MFAANKPGRLSTLPFPPVIETLAQFMYISRLPMLLNHDQARMALPALTSCGTVKVKPWLTHSPEPPVQAVAIGSRFPLASVGQPPIQLCKTFQLAGFLTF